MSPIKMAERDALAAWLLSLQYVVIRDLESALPALTPNGRRLRGVQLTEDLVIGRDRVLYLLDAKGEAIPTTPTHVLSFISFDALRMRYEDKVAQHRRRHGGTPTENALPSSRPAR